MLGAIRADAESQTLCHPLSKAQQLYVKIQELFFVERLQISGGLVVYEWRISDVLAAN
jgi:hypothetical protein